MVISLAHELFMTKLYTVTLRVLDMHKKVELTCNLNTLGGEWLVWCYYNTPF